MGHFLWVGWLDSPGREVPRLVCLSQLAKVGAVVLELPRAGARVSVGSVAVVLVSR